jgi:hypothetical protein
MPRADPRGGRVDGGAATGHVFICSVCVRGGKRVEVSTWWADWDWDL